MITNVPCSAKWAEPGSSNCVGPEPGAGLTQVCTPGQSGSGCTNHRSVARPWTRLHRWPSLHWSAIPLWSLWGRTWRHCKSWWVDDQERAAWGSQQRRAQLKACRDPVWAILVKGWKTDTLRVLSPCVTFHSFIAPPVSTFKIGLLLSVLQSVFYFLNHRNDEICMKPFFYNYERTK